MTPAERTRAATAVRCIRINVVIHAAATAVLGGVLAAVGVVLAVGAYRDGRGPDYGLAAVVLGQALLAFTMATASARDVARYGRMAALIDGGRDTLDAFLDAAAAPEDR